MYRYARGSIHNINIIINIIYFFYFTGSPALLSKVQFWYINNVINEEPQINV